MTRFVPVLAVAALLAAGPARADGGGARSDTLTVRMPEVVVTALRGQDRLRDVPAAAYVIPREAVLRSGDGRISALLQSLPGLYGYLRNASGDPAAVDPRGFTANGTSSYMKLLVDGMDVRDLENGNVDWDWLPASDVKRVEVVEGPGTWIYGDGSEGGIVNVVRGTPAPGLHAGATVRGGSFGMRAGGATVSGARGAWDGSLRGSGRDVDGWRDHSRERVWSGGGRGRWTAGPRTTLSLDVNGLDADRQNPGTLTAAQMAADREQSETSTDYDHSKRLLIGARLRHEDAGGGTWTLDPHLSGENLDQVSTIFFQTKFHHTRGWNGGADLGWRRTTTVGGRTATFDAGVGIERGRLRSQYRDFSSGTAGPLEANTLSWRTTASAWAGAELTLDSRTTGRVGLRGDLIRVHANEELTGGEVPSRDLDAVSPFVSMTRRLGATASVYASFSAAFHAPTLAQLFDRRPFYNPYAMSNVFLSNPSLAPQRARSVEVGGRIGDPAGANATLTLYSVRVRDEIDFDVATLSYDNIGRSWHRGVQGSAQHPLGRFVTARAGGAWTPTTIRGGADDGNQINAVPIGTAFGSLRWTPVRPLSVEGAVRWVGRQYLDKGEKHPLPEFTVTDLTAALHVARAVWTVRVANLFDRRYADTGYFDDLSGDERLSPAPGRSVQVAVGLE